MRPHLLDIMHNLDVFTRVSFEHAHNPTLLSMLSFFFELSPRVFLNSPLLRLSSVVLQMSWLSEFVIHVLA